MTTITHCHRCHAGVSNADDYCGFCGAPLRELSISPARIVLREDLEGAQIKVRSQGVKEASFVLRASDVRHFPAWLTHVDVADTSTTLARGQEKTLALTFAPEALPSGSAREKHERARGHHVVELLTDSLVWDNINHCAARKTLRLELAAQSKPRARPEVISYRFLPSHLIEAEHLRAHRVEVINEGGHAIDLVSITVRNAPLGESQNAARIDAKAIVVVPPLVRAHRLEPDAIFDAKFALKLEEGALAKHAPNVRKNGLAVFAAELVFSFRGKSKDAIARIEGVVGVAPTLTHSDEVENIIRAAGGPAPGHISFKNSGSIPLRILGFGILLDDKTPVHKRDWLTVSGVKSGTLLAAGDEYSIDLWVDPQVRSPDAMDMAWDKRVVRVFHDGESAHQNDDGTSYIDTPISAELGTIRALSGAVVGVDFGTSNSSVCLLHGQSGEAQSLFLDADSGVEALASLLFYRGARDDSPSLFLFGASAQNAASLNYANLVRSIKSVIAKDKDAAYHFVESGKSGTRQLATYSSQKLLEIFLGELKRRAESGVRRLPVPLLQTLDLLDTGVRFDRAVFTHPVGAQQDTIRSLFLAAKSAGFFNDNISFEDFEKDWTLDEASAAVVSFVYTAVSMPDDFVLSDDERIICVDVGGGTTDLAAVRVRDLASFRRGEKDRVVLERLASGGEGHLGGDDLDRVLGELILKKAAGHKDAAALDIDAVHDAMRFPSFETYRRSVLERARVHHTDLAEQSEHARRVFSKANNILRHAERAKRVLTLENQTTVIPDTDDWPLKDTRTKAKAGMRLQIEISRGEAAALYAPLFEKGCIWVKDILRDSSWTANDVTCVLFTGQGSRVPELRTAITQTLLNERSHKELRVIEPDALEGFDCKRCVAMGAAIFGDSKAGGGAWLTIEEGAKDAMPFSLQTRRGPRFFDVDGLQAGSALPARALHRFTVPTKVLTLYRSRALAFTFTFDEAVSEVELTMHSPSNISARAGEQEVQGVSA